MKGFKKFTAVVIVVMIVSALFVPTVIAEREITFTLRIEGANQCVYYDTVYVTGEDNLTLKKALLQIDEKSDDLSFTGIETNYITVINDEYAGAFGGYDGWLYQVNEIDALAGIDSCEIKDGDSVVFYYGDPFGAGMQYPRIDTKGVANGELVFTSLDTIYDANYNPSVIENPVKNATVSWYNGDKVYKYTTDDNGSVIIDSDNLTQGAHRIQIEKYAQNGLPLVLRFADDFAIDITDLKTVNEEKAETSEPEISEPITDTDLDNPETGDNKYVFILIFLSLCGAAVMMKIKRFEV